MRLEMDRGQRWLVGVVYPVAYLVVAFGPFVIRWGDLPDPMATQFGSDRMAEGRVPVVVYLALTVGIVTAACAALVWAVWRSPHRMGPHAPVVAFVGWLTSLLSAFIVFANAGHDRWQDVTLGSGAMWGSGASAVGGSLWVALLITRPQRQEMAATDGHAFRLSPGERAAWFGGARSVPLALGAMALAIVGSVGMLSLRSFPAAAGVVIAGVVVAALVSVDVTVSEQGLVVRSGVFGWPRVRFDLDAISSARAYDLNPWWWLGWGYRYSVRLFRRAAWVVRSGEALEITMHNGRRFAVTVDDAAEAAEVLNGLLARPSPEVRS